MDTLHDRLAQLADDAPSGGVPAAELWARGKRVHRRRAAALAATLLVVGAVGTGIGVRLADGDGNRSDPAPAEPVGITLPIEYPVGEELPDLGETPGPLAAIWSAHREGGGAPEVVGLVAETGTFGTLPIDLPEDDPQAPQDVVALSPDGRRIAYPSPAGELVVRDLVTGENDSPVFDFEIRSAGGATWADATHLVGLTLGGSDVDGWVWEPGTAPKLVNPHLYLEGYDGRDLWVLIGWGDAGKCSSSSWTPVVGDATGRLEVPVLCDILGLIGSEYALGHGDPDRFQSDWNDPNDGEGTVVAVDISDATTYPFGSPYPQRDSQFDDPALTRLVVTAGAPERVRFATDLIGEALDAEGGAS